MIVVLDAPPSSQWESLLERRRPVAVKMLHNVEGPAALKNFESEVSVLSRLKHPHIVCFFGGASFGA